MDSNSKPAFAQGSPATPPLWEKCQWCEIKVCLNPSDPTARLAVWNHLCLGKLTEINRQLEAAAQPERPGLLCDQAEEVTLASHTKHVEAFLQGMYATMVDPVEQPRMNVAELCELLLRRAREDREALHSQSVAPQSAPGPQTPKCNCADISGNAGPCPTHAAPPQSFEDWWEADGRFFDPDFSEVPWFDKRKDLAEYAWHRSGHVSPAVLTEAANIITNACQIIDVTKAEWSETSVWSDWDQSVRDAASEWLKKFHGSVAPPEAERQQESE
jgi:hypothetical protein